MIRLGRSTQPAANFKELDRESRLTVVHANTFQVVPLDPFLLEAINLVIDESNSDAAPTLSPHGVHTPHHRNQTLRGCIL